MEANLAREYLVFCEMREMQVTIILVIPVGLI
jgi:hypothetical protein